MQIHKRSNYCPLILLVLVLFPLGGCGSFLKRGRDPAGHGSLIDQVEPPLQSPFQLTISDESYTGDTLIIRGGVTSAIPWTPQEVAIQLVGYREGKEAARSTMSVAALAEREDVPPVFDAEEELRFSASISGRDLAHYQIELLWGKDAERALSRAQRPELLNLRVTTEPCRDGGNCKEQYRISASLRNGGTTPLDDQTVGISYRWVPDGQAGALNRFEARSDYSEQIEGEEFFTLHDLSLAPGADHPLSLVVPLAQSTETGGRFEPYVRLVPKGEGK